MTNREKHKLNSGMILANISEGKFWYCNFARKYILKRDPCAGVYCNDCRVAFDLWLDEEAEEEPFDWSKVEQGTVIWVSDNKSTWFEMEFVAMYENFVITYDRKRERFVPWKYGMVNK